MLLYQVCTYTNAPASADAAFWTSASTLSLNTTRRPSELPSPARAEVAASASRGQHAQGRGRRRPYPDPLRLMHTPVLTSSLGPARQLQQQREPRPAVSFRHQTHLLLSPYRKPLPCFSFERSRPSVRKKLSCPLGCLSYSRSTSRMDLPEPASATSNCTTTPTSSPCTLPS